jgi:Zn-dependent protease with chaperone function
VTEDRFDDLVGKLEREAREHPGRYRRRLTLLSWLGSAYLYGVVLLLGAGIYLCVRYLLATQLFVGLKLTAFLLVPLLLVLKSLWVRIGPPGGLGLDARGAPALFGMIEELRAKLAAPPFHRVLIDEGFNAGVVQVPKLGIFGWHENYLVIGLPLLASLSVTQFKAVLAHEFGHLSGGHGTTANSIYRQRLRWNRTMRALDAHGRSGRLLVKRFFDWYAPYFAACSFPLARANEYEADATSARLTSSRDAAEALTGVAVVGTYLGERYWPALFDRVATEPKPNFVPYASLGRDLSEALDPDGVRAYIDRAMQVQTSSADTHPSLADRLRALGEAPRIALPERSEAADTLLGEALPALQERLDALWRERVEPGWTARHEALRADRERLATLDGRASTGAPLTLDERIERARLSLEGGADGASGLAQLRDLHRELPDHAPVSFLLGCALLARQDPAGIACLERAASLDDNATGPVCERLRDYFQAAGNLEAAREQHERLVLWTSRHEDLRREGARVTLRDRFESHGLEPAALAELRACLRNIPAIREAWLVRKILDGAPATTLFVLGYATRRLALNVPTVTPAGVLQRVGEAMALPGHLTVIEVGFANRRFRRKFRGVPDASV